MNVGLVILGIVIIIPSLFFASISTNGIQQYQTDLGQVAIALDADSYDNYSNLVMMQTLSIIGAVIGFIITIAGFASPDESKKYANIYQPYAAPPPGTPYSQSYPCVYCGQHLTFVPQNNRWYCYSCGSYN